MEQITFPNEYPESKALLIKHLKEPNTIVSVVRTERGHLCGYVRFPSRPVREVGYRGFLNYVPVHGGITYTQDSTDGSVVYAFDCAHVGDELQQKFSSPEWVLSEAIRMSIAISVAAKWEEFYLLAKSNDTKAEVISAYHEELSENHDIHFILTDNFGAMISVICGQL